MKKLLAALKAAEEKANKAYDAYDAEPENETLEKAFDKAYKKEFEAIEKLATAICKTSHGMINMKTARTMIRAKRPELEALINRMA